MNTQLSITTNQSALQSFLNADLPEGIKIVSSPNAESRDLSVNVNFDIQLTVDLTKITAYALAGWAIKRCLRLPGNTKVNINGNQIPIDDPKAIELVTKEIENKNKD